MKSRGAGGWSGGVGDMKLRGLEDGVEVRSRSVGPSCCDCMDATFRG